MTVVESSITAPASARISSIRGYDLVIQACVVAWFSLLAWRLGNALAASVTVLHAGGASSVVWPSAVSETCLMLFYITVSWLSLARPRPLLKARGVLPRIVAFLGCNGILLLVFVPRPDISATQHLVSAAIIVLGNIATLLVLLRLGRSFSIMAEARKLVTGGPYAVVRHPLYLAEEIAIIGVFVQYASWTMLPLFALHFGFQLQRMRYEEGVLREAFPDYDAYARRTARLIPGIW
jgi:protein-S-isoprenylcysteine O-methyltransferase Ste14